MYAALRVHLSFVGPGGIGQLGALQDVEIVVGSVAAGVSFGTDCSSCDGLEQPEKGWKALLTEDD
jgi:hypothetical protein